MITRLVSGKKYRVVGSQSCHGTPIGSIVTITSSGGPWTISPGNPTFGFTARDEAGRQFTYYAVDIAEIMWTNRKEHAEEVKKEMDAKQKSHDMEMKKLQRLYERLSKYETDEEEYATMIVKAIKGADSEKESIKNLAKTLKERFEYLEAKS